MKRIKFPIILISFLIWSGYSCAQCDFQKFVKTYFDVYEAYDTLIELKIYGTGGHEWQFNKTDDCYDYALKYFPSTDWASACVCHTNNHYVLEFWNEVYTDTALINNTLLLLCNEEGEIVDKTFLNDTGIEYADVNRNSVWSMFYAIKDTIIWRLYKDVEDGEYAEQRFKIDRDKIIILP